jgi:hypothetical protein
MHHQVGARHCGGHAGGVGNVALNPFNAGRTEPGGRCLGPADQRPHLHAFRQEPVGDAAAHGAGNASHKSSFVA